MTWLALILLLIASPAWSAIAYVDSAGGGTASGTAPTLTIPAGCQGRQAIVAIASNPIGGDSITSVADTSGSTYTAVTSGNDLGFNYGALYRTANVIGSGDTLTVTFSAAHDIAIALACYSGGAAFGNSNVNTGGSTTSTVDVTTQDNNNYVAAGHAVQDTVSSCSVGTLRINQFSGGAVTVGISDNTAASPGTVTNTCTIASGSAIVTMGQEIRTVGPAAIFRRREQ